jgi:hypothetical protein
MIKIKRCEGSCDPHDDGDVLRYWVVAPDGQDWGLLNLCSKAVSDGVANNFLVTEWEDSSVPEETE